MKLNYGQFLGRTTRVCNAPGFTFSEVIDSDIPEMPLHTHANDHFLMIIRGEYITDACKSNPIVGSTTLIFNPAGTTHRDRFRTRGGRFLTISIDPLLAQRLQTSHALRETAGVFRDTRENWIATRLYREFAHADVLSDNVAEGIALELFSLVAPTTERDSKPPSWLRRACELIEDRVHESVRVAQIAVEVGVHPFHLTRTFRRFLHCTTGEYLRACRLRRAAEMLRNSRISVSAVAYQTGYPDQSHLTHSLRKHIGYTPAAYRRAFGMLD